MNLLRRSSWLVALLLCSCTAEIDDWWGDEDEDVAGQGEMLVSTDPGDTRNAELVRFLHVGQSRSRAQREVVLRLSPHEIPSLQRGDRLITPAEVEVTTRCDIGQDAPGCDYNPSVAAQIILTGRRDDVRAVGRGSAAFSDVQTLTCTKNEHHCRIVFTPGQVNHVLRNAFDLPCVHDDSCYVNLVMWAWDSHARSGGRDRLIVGANEGNFLDEERSGHAARGRESDKGRLMAIRERGVRPAERDRVRTSGHGSVRIPTNGHEHVIYSLSLGRRLRAGDQFVVEAKVVTDVSSRANFTTKLVVTENRHGRDPGRVAHMSISPSAISEHNGINCTEGTTPCTTRRVAVFRVTRDIAGPVYVNLVANAEVPGPGSARVTVRRDQGWLRATRYRDLPDEARSARSDAEADVGTDPGERWYWGDCEAPSCVDGMGNDVCAGELGDLDCSGGTQLCVCNADGTFSDCGACEAL